MPREHPAGAITVRSMATGMVVVAERLRIHCSPGCVFCTIAGKKCSVWESGSHNSWSPASGAAGFAGAEILVGLPPERMRGEAENLDSVLVATTKTMWFRS